MDAPKNNRVAKALIILFGGLGPLVMVLFGIKSCSEPRVPEYVPPDATARSMCRYFIRRTLHDPSSVEWVEADRWPTQHDAAGWSVRAKYRAKNGFGALVLQRTECRLAKMGEQWSLTGRTDY